MLPDASKNLFGSYAGNRTTLCRAAVQSKSTNKNTNKKQSDPAGAHYLVNTSHTQRPPRQKLARFFRDHNILLSHPILAYV